MNKWGYAIISIGCVSIASSPIMGDKALMILSGLVTVAVGVVMVTRKKGKE